MFGQDVFAWSRLEGNCLNPDEADESDKDRFRDLIHPFISVLVFSPKPVRSQTDYASLNLNYPVATNLDEKGDGTFNGVLGTYQTTSIKPFSIGIKLGLYLKLGKK